MVSRKHVSTYELDEFFNRTNDQMIRITSNQGGNSIANNSQLENKVNLHPKFNDQKIITLADIYPLASHVAKKMSQSKYKIDVEPIRGFRLPSTTISQEYEAKKTSSSRRHSIRLIDILPKNDYFEQPSSSSDSSPSKPSVQSSPQRLNTSFK